MSDISSVYLTRILISLSATPSLISATHQSLPFGCRVNIVNDIQCIISKFLTFLYHDGIPWDEFYSVELPQEEVTRPIYTLDVWMTRLPSTITEQA